VSYYQDNHITLYNSSCFDMSKLPDESVQCVVTSPPYWGLRKYAGEQELVWGGNKDCEHEWDSYIRPKNTWGTPNKNVDGMVQTIEQGFCSLCGAWKGSYGMEPTPEMYIEHTILILREIRRVLRKDGVVFWNIGDTFYGGNKGYGDTRPPGSSLNNKNNEKFGDPIWLTAKKAGLKVNLKPKDLALIPFRVAIAAQDDGWWVRSDIIWSKPNPMPESVTDRPTTSHEHILMLTKSAKYYWDAEAVREVATGFDGRKDTMMKPSGKYSDRNIRNEGDNPNSVHTRGAERWPKSVKYEGTDYGGNGTSFRGHSGHTKGDGTMMLPGRNIRDVWKFTTQPYHDAHFAVFPERLPELCIKAATKPDDLVLDPFSGSGTTLWVAKKLNRHAVGYELSEEYCKLIIKRNRQQVFI